MTKMPALFIGHGSPMNALEVNAFSGAWRDIGAALPRPRAILCISAHWFIGSTVVTAMPHPRTIHDFYGFPQPLFDVTYPAPGDPEIAQRIADIAAPDWVGLDRDQWGIDHGAWSVLVHMFPAADVPVLQLSINSMKPFDYHMALGAKLAALRDEGVLVLASGNVVHNLGEIQWKRPSHGEDWAHRFDDRVGELMQSDPGSLEQATQHPDYARSVPTPEHFLPLAYIAGMASAGNDRVPAMTKGYAMGSLSMTSYALGDIDISMDKGGSAAGVPREIDPENTNL